MRGAYGLALVAVAGAGDRPRDGVTRAAAVVLGARHALEALLLARHTRLLAAVDVVHATSMLLFARFDERRRTAALTSAAVSLLLASASLRQAPEPGVARLRAPAG